MIYRIHCNYPARHLLCPTATTSSSKFTNFSNILQQVLKDHLRALTLSPNFSCVPLPLALWQTLLTYKHTTKKRQEVEEDKQKTKTEEKNKKEDEEEKNEKGGGGWREEQGKEKDKLVTCAASFNWLCRIASNPLESLANFCPCDQCLPQGPGWESC